METVDDLREAIRLSTPPNNRDRSFARVFQSLRIAVNEELQHLKIFLEKLINILAVGARIVIISYHSLEDRMVKLAFKKYKSDGALSILTKKPLIPQDQEIILNSRAKSAKMRVGERIDA
jgi:16S rRNA (cytosine1402-N4)-methyltransferase